MTRKFLKRAIRLPWSFELSGSCRKRGIKSQIDGSVDMTSMENHERRYCWAMADGSSIHLTPRTASSTLYMSENCSARSSTKQMSTMRLTMKRPSPTASAQV